MKRSGWMVFVALFAMTVVGPAGAFQTATRPTTDGTEGVAPAEAGATTAGLVGVWAMHTEFQGDQIPATMTISLAEGKLVGIWTSTGQDMKISELAFDGEAITFNRTMGAGGALLVFEGTLKNGEIAGHYLIPSGQRLACKGKRKP